MFQKLYVRSSPTRFDAVAIIGHLLPSRYLMLFHLESVFKRHSTLSLYFLLNVLDVIIDL